MENGQELTRAGCHPKPRRHFGFCREGAVPPSSRLWDEDVPRDAACAGCSLHPVFPHGDVPVQSGPPGCPLVIHPTCHPQGLTMQQCPCVQTMWLEGQWLQVTERQQVRDAPGVFSSLHGFWGAVFLLPCLWQADCGTEGGTPVALPSLPALPPAACPQPSWATSPSVFLINQDW